MFSYDSLCFSQISQLAHERKPCMLLDVVYFWFKTGKSSWVPSRTQGIVPIVIADGQMYYDYCFNCLYPAMCDN
jgi:hypothetical protein